MQNALAIIPIPVGPVQSAPTDPEPPLTSQEFAVAFAAEQPELAGDAPLGDPGIIASDQAVAWTGPILPVSGVVPVGMQAAFGGNEATDDGVAAYEAVALNPEQSQARPPVEDVVAEVVAEDNPKKAVGFGEAWSGADPDPRRAVEGPRVIGATGIESTTLPDRTSEGPAVPSKRPAVSGSVNADAGHGSATRISVEGAGLVSLDTIHFDASAPPVSSLPKEASATGESQGLQNVKSDAMLVGEVAAQAPLAELTRLAPDSSTSEASLVAAMPIARPVEAPSSRPLFPAVPLAAGEPTPDGSDAAKPAQADVSLRQAQERAAAITVPTVETKVPTAQPLAPAMLAEPLGLTSFWERYLANEAEPLRDNKPAPVAIIPPDKVALVPAVPTPAALGLSSLAVPGRKGSEADELPIDAESVLTDAGSEVVLTAPTNPWTPSPVPAPKFDLVPVLTVLPWGEETIDLIEGVDSGPLPTFQSPGPGQSVATGAGGSLSLPVQSVAAQIAGVLVRSSDRITELALAPEELGKVRLRLEPDAANPDRLTILINVERPETLDLFRRHAGELAEAIRNAGYSGAQIDFGRQGQDGGGHQNHGRSSAGPELAFDDVAPIQHSPRIMAGATLDLRL